MKAKAVTGILCLLLLSLLATGCQSEKDTLPPPLITVPVESIEGLTNLNCSVYVSGEEHILMGDRAVELYSLLYQAMSESREDALQSPPAAEPYVSVSFYVKGDITDSPETTAESFLVGNTHFYGSFGVYQSGFLRFSLSPLHSHAYEYQVEEGLYEAVMGYLK